MDSPVEKILAARLAAVRQLAEERAKAREADQMALARLRRAVLSADTAAGGDGTGRNELARAAAPGLTRKPVFELLRGGGSLLNEARAALAPLPVTVWADRETGKVFAGLATVDADAHPSGHACAAGEGIADASDLVQTADTAAALLTAAGLAFAADRSTYARALSGWDRAAEIIRAAASGPGQKADQ